MAGLPRGVAAGGATHQALAANASALFKLALRRSCDNRTNEVVQRVAAIVPQLTDQVAASEGQLPWITGSARNGNAQCRDAHVPIVAQPKPDRVQKIRDEHDREFDELAEHIIAIHASLREMRAALDA